MLVKIYEYRGVILFYLLLLLMLVAMSYRANTIDMQSSNVIISQ